MRQSHHAGLDLDEKAPSLQLGEFSHRIRKIFAAIQTAVRQTQPAGAGDYRLESGRLGLTQLVKQTVRPYAANGALVHAGGPDLQLEPELLLALRLVFHELATNARKYGALSSPAGCVKIEWKIRRNRGARILAIGWSEYGGPEVKPRARKGFGIRFIESVLEGYGRVRLHFDPGGVACFILIELDAAAPPLLHPVLAA
ncbi:MAG: hypothetical protein ACLPX9_02350 [Rhodomicrobium sp.]